MPDDANGNNSLPNGYLAVTGNDVLPSNHNPPLEDLSACMTNRVHRDGRAPMLGPLNMNSFKVRNLLAGVADGDAVNVGQTPALLAANTAVATSKATPVDADALPLSDSEASNALKKLTWANLKVTLKTYLDTLYGTIDSVVAKAGDTMTGPLKLSGDPTDPLHAAPKRYVDGHPGGATVWGNFNGIGTPAIRDSYNVSSITDNGVGDYTINFATALANSNYAVLLAGVASSTDSGIWTNAVYGLRGTRGAVTQKDTTGVRLVCGNTSAQSLVDPVEYSVAIYGG